MCLEISNNCYRMPQNAFFSTNSRSSGQQKNDAKTLFFIFHPLSTVIFATATVLAFVLLRNSRFNFHCYTQREAKPTQKSARKCAVTSRDFLRERLQSAFTLANQLRWIAHRQSFFTSNFDIVVSSHLSFCSQSSSTLCQNTCFSYRQTSVKVLIVEYWNTSLEDSSNQPGVRLTEITQWVWAGYCEIWTRGV